MWRELVLQYFGDMEPIGDSDPGPEFFPGATPEQLAEVERQIGVLLPESLKELLAESNGVLVTFGTHLIWSTNEIVLRNVELRTNPIYQEGWMPFDHLFFFADAGVDGILFAFGIIQGAIRREDVYVWDPNDDGRTWKAPSLKLYIEWWGSGKLKV